MKLPRRTFLCLSLAALLPGIPRAGAQERLTEAQAARLKKLFPRTYPKMTQRIPLLTAAAGDSISTFYQPDGHPRYDSALAWHGRVLSVLGSFFHYHGGVVDLVPNKDLRDEQKAAAAAIAAHEAAVTAWEKDKKGEMPKAPNPLWFDATAVRPSALRVDDMLRHRTPTAAQPVETSVIRVLNAARDGSLSPQVQEALTTQIYPPGSASVPDLVTICYGVNDAVNQYSLVSYRYFLEDAVRRCKAAGSDVLLAAPPVALGADPRLDVGRSRPYAAVMREVAEAEGVAFVDLGDAMVRAPSNLQALTAEEAFDAAMDMLRHQFLYGADVNDTLHPNLEATARAGEAAASALLREPVKPALDIMGELEVTGEDAATLRVRVFNASPAARAVVVSPLTVAGWRAAPGTADALFNLEPGKAKRLSFPCVRHTSRLTGEAAARGALLVTDDDEQRLVDLTIKALPVAVKWEDARIDRASGDVLLTPELMNTSPKAVSGTAQVEWMGRVQELPVKLEAKGKQPLPIRLALPEDSSPNARFVGAVNVKLKVEDRTVTFRKTVEGVRHMGLTHRMPLGLTADTGKEPGVTEEPAAGGWVTAFAHASGLYLVVETPPNAAAGERAPGSVYGTIDVQLDARNAAENGTIGFVDRLTADIPWEDAAMTVKPPRPAVFGTGYAAEYSPKGFASKVVTRPDGGRRIEFNIARANFIHHEWSLDGSGQNSLGINVRLSFFQPKDAPAAESRACQLALSGFPGTDARSLTLLELSGSPSRRWSLRVY